MQGKYYKVIYDEDQKKNAANYVLAQPTSPAFSVQCKLFRPPKTLAQLKKIHAMIDDIAKHLKKDKRTVKIDVKVAFGVYHVYTSSIDGSRQVILKSFEDYSREELLTTISALEVWCQEKNINIEDRK